MRKKEHVHQVPIHKKIKDNYYECIAIQFIYRDKKGTYINYKNKKRYVIPHRNQLGRIEYEVKQW